jgi:hypothetical protein
LRGLSARIAAFQPRRVVFASAVDWNAEAAMALAAAA